MRFRRRKEADNERFIAIDSGSSPIRCIIACPLANEILLEKMIPPNILGDGLPFVVDNAEESNLLCGARRVVPTDLGLWPV